MGWIRFGHELGLLSISDTDMFMKLYYHAGSASMKEIRGFSQKEEEKSHQGGVYSKEGKKFGEKRRR